MPVPVPVPVPVPGSVRLRGWHARTPSHQDLCVDACCLQAHGMARTGQAHPGFRSQTFEGIFDRAPTHVSQGQGTHAPTHVHHGDHPTQLQQRRQHAQRREHAQQNAYTATHASSPSSPSAPHYALHRSTHLGKAPAGWIDPPAPANSYAGLHAERTSPQPQHVAGQGRNGNGKGKGKKGDASHRQAANSMPPLQLNSFVLSGHSITTPTPMHGTMVPSGRGVLAQHVVGPAHRQQRVVGNQRSRQYQQRLQSPASKKKGRGHGAHVLNPAGGMMPSRATNTTTTTNTHTMLRDHARARTHTRSPSRAPQRISTCSQHQQQQHHHHHQQRGHGHSHDPYDNLLDPHYASTAAYPPKPGEDDGGPHNVHDGHHYAAAIDTADHHGGYPAGTAPQTFLPSRPLSPPKAWKAPQMPKSHHAHDFRTNDGCASESEQQLRYRQPPLTQAGRPAVLIYDKGSARPRTRQGRDEISSRGTNTPKRRTPRRKQPRARTPPADTDVIDDLIPLPPPAAEGGGSADESGAEGPPQAPTQAPMVIPGIQQPKEPPPTPEPPCDPLPTTQPDCPAIAAEPVPAATAATATAAVTTQEDEPSVGAIEQDCTHIPEPTPPAVPEIVEVVPAVPDPPEDVYLKGRHGVKILKDYTLANGARLFVSKGTVVQFRGDAIVNAAAEELGINRMINTMGGEELVAARERLLEEAQRGATNRGMYARFLATSRLYPAPCTLHLVFLPCPCIRVLHAGTCSSNALPCFNWFTATRRSCVGVGWLRCARVCVRAFRSIRTQW